MSAMSKERLMNVLIAPHVSEKSARVAEQGNQFVFRVRTRCDQAGHPRGRRADVRRQGRLRAGAQRAGQEQALRPRQGRRSDWKKAYVRLAAGQTIDLGGAERA